MNVPRRMSPDIILGLGYNPLKCTRPVDGAELCELTLQILVPSSVPSRSILFLSTKIAANHSYRLVSIPGVVRRGRTAIKCVQVPFTERANFTLHHVELCQVRRALLGYF